MTQSIGHGHLYQGAYKSFPIQEDKHLWDVIRYVEQNPLRAKLCEKAQEWRWSSLFKRIRKNKEDIELLAKLPTTLPSNYLSSVNTLLDSGKIGEIQHSINKGAPYGGEEWVEETVSRYHMERTQRGPGRPRGS
jgi:putative transposase